MYKNWFYKKAFWGLQIINKIQNSGFFHFFALIWKNIWNEFTIWNRRLRREPQTSFWLYCSTFANKYLELNENYLDPLFPKNRYKGLKILKMPDNSRVVWIRDRNYHNLTKLQPTPEFFLSICYKYFDDNDEQKMIYIDLPKEYYISRNEILSAEFIERWFEHNEGMRTKFSPNYVLEIMDRDLNIIEIDCTKYVFLEEDKYYVIPIIPIPF
jgi:hypothetical protein